MVRSTKYKSPRVDHDWTKARKLNAPISIEDLMVKDLPLSLEDGEMCKLSLHTDTTNEDSTHVKRKIRILDNPKNLIEVLRARLAIAQGLTGKNITMVPNEYRLPEPSYMGKRYVSSI